MKTPLPRLTVPRARAPVRPALVTTGIVMVAALFLYANPLFGAKAAKWPWQHFVEATLLARKADLLLWVAAAAAAIVVGTGRGGRFRLAWLAVPALLLLVRCYGEAAAFTAVKPNEPTLAWFVAATCLGAGLVVLGSGGERGRGAARVLAAVGAVGIVAAYAITFRRADQCVIWDFRQDYANAWEKLFGGAEKEPEYAKKMWQQWWGSLFPMALLVAAAGTGAVLSVVRSSGRAVRIAAWVAWACAFARWVAPPVATLWLQRDLFTSRTILGVAAEGLGRTIFDAGLGLWLLTTFSLATALREPAAAAASLSEPGTAPEPQAGASP